jgi:hypothetical protein
LLIINIFFNVETQYFASPAYKSNLANPLVWRETQSIASLQESRLQLCHYCFFQLELVDTRNDDLFYQVLCLQFPQGRSPETFYSNGFQPVEKADKELREP